MRFYIDWGLNDREVERLTGIPRSTVRGWRRRSTLGQTIATGQNPSSAARCPICERRPFDERRYTYLLGLYLGDGCLSEHARNVFRLRIVLDQKYTNIIGECTEAIESVAENLTVGFSQRPGCIEVSAYWKHWPCLFPQHGPGRKHERSIELAEWQRQVVRSHPAPLLRGLIHSDGCRGTNTVRRRVDGRLKTYSYPRYQFTNESREIKQLFCDACDRLGVSWRRMNRKTISVAKAQDVENLDSVIGPKS